MAHPAAVYDNYAAALSETAHPRAPGVAAADCVSTNSIFTDQLIMLGDFSDTLLVLPRLLCRTIIVILEFPEIVYPSDLGGCWRCSHG